MWMRRKDCRQLSKIIFTLYFFGWFPLTSAESSPNRNIVFRRNEIKKEKKMCGGKFLLCNNINYIKPNCIGDKQVCRLQKKSHHSFPLTLLYITLWFYLEKYLLFFFLVHNINSLFSFFFFGTDFYTKVNTIFSRKTKHERKNNFQHVERIGWKYTFSTPISR